MVARWFVCWMKCVRVMLWVMAFWIQIGVKPVGVLCLMETIDILLVVVAVRVDFAVVPLRIQIWMVKKGRKHRGITAWVIFVVIAIYILHRMKRKGKCNGALFWEEAMWVVLIMIDSGVVHFMIAIGVEHLMEAVRRVFRVVPIRVFPIMIAKLVQKGMVGGVVFMGKYATRISFIVVASWVFRLMISIWVGSWMIAIWSEFGVISMWIPLWMKTVWVTLRVVAFHIRLGVVTVGIIFAMKAVWAKLWMKTVWIIVGVVPIWVRPVILWDFSGRSSILALARPWSIIF